MKLYNQTVYVSYCDSILINYISFYIIYVLLYLIHFEFFYEFKNKLIPQILEIILVKMRDQKVLFTRTSYKFWYDATLCMCLYGTNFSLIAVASSCTIGWNATQVSFLNFVDFLHKHSNLIFCTMISSCNLIESWINDFFCWYKFLYVYSVCCRLNINKDPFF